MTSLMGRAGDEHTMMTVGLGVVGSTYSFASEYDVADGTPLAQLMSEPEGILVAADSPYRTVDDFAEAWAADPASIPIGGVPARNSRESSGSALGSASRR